MTPLKENAGILKPDNKHKHSNKSGLLSGLCRFIVFLWLLLIQSEWICNYQVPMPNK